MARSEPRGPSLPTRLRRTRSGRLGVTAGAVGVVVLIAVGVSVLQPDLPSAVTAMLLVVPVVAASALGGRAPGLTTAGLATIALTVSLPPLGSLQVALPSDLVALVVFMGVAVVVSTLVSREIDALDDIERQRRLLLRSVSHDLRTPLTTIRGVSSELLADAGHDEATRRRLLELMEAEATRLDRLVNNLLTLSRIESGAMRPRTERFDVGALVRRAVAHHDATADPSAPIEVRIPDGLPRLEADPAQMEQVVSNLVDNAVRHSPPDEPVVVSARMEDTRMVLTVEDAGPGVPPDEAAELFEPFRSGSVPGSEGLGLAICRAVVVGHGGTIAVDERPGGGARFTVRLPRDQPRRRVVGRAGHRAGGRG